MADIKTRQSKKGTIRTIDRASAMTSHVKDVHARTKEEMLHSREQSRKWPVKKWYETLMDVPSTWICPRRLVPGTRSWPAICFLFIMR